MKRIFTIKEASEESGLTEHAIRMGIKQGLFQAFQFHRKGKYFIPSQPFIEKLNTFCSCDDGTNNKLLKFR